MNIKRDVFIRIRLTKMQSSTFKIIILNNKKVIYWVTQEGEVVLCLKELTS